MLTSKRKYPTKTLTIWFNSYYLIFSLPTVSQKIALDNLHHPGLELNIFSVILSHLPDIEILSPTNTYIKNAISVMNRQT